MFFQHVQVILTLQLAIVCSLQFGIIVISSYSHLKKRRDFYLLGLYLLLAAANPTAQN